MIFKYDVLSDIIRDDKTIDINDNSYLKKIPGLNGVEYGVRDSNRFDYYVFLKLNEQESIVISTDNHTGLGFELLRVPTKDFFVEINTDNNLVDYYDGPGTQTDFPDVIEPEDLDKKFREDEAKADHELKETPLYQQVDRCVSKYLLVDQHLEEQLNLLIIHLAFLSKRASKKRAA